MSRIVFAVGHVGKGLYERCPDCLGQGVTFEYRTNWLRYEREPGPEQPCGTCRGTGWVKVDEWHGDDSQWGEPCVRL